jgi:hypothetical protein
LDLSEVEYIILADIAVFGGVTRWKTMSINKEEMELINRIIEIIEQDGDEVSDGECIDQIVQHLRFFGFEIRL